MVRRLLIFTSVFILFTGGLLAFFHQLGLFEVHSIAVDVDGFAGFAKTPGPMGLKARLQESVKPFENKKIWQIHLQDMKAAIVRDEWVKEVLISRTFPAGLHIEVKPKMPVLVLVSSSNALLPVTEDGSLLNALPANAFPDAPLLRGELFLRDKAMRAKMLSFISDLPEHGPISRKNISEITWNKDDGVILTLMQPKLELKLGDERLSMKVLRADQVINYLAANQLKGRVIDASFSKKVLVRLRKGP
jgi:cell division septal protein FtsQ